MSDETTRAADEALEAAIQASGARDPREFYRERLRALKDSNPDGYRSAVTYYRETLIPAVAEGTEPPLEAWTEYGRMLAETLSPGRTVSIDASGRAHPYESPDLDRLEEDSEIQVAGLVVARQRPETAKGYSFILLEDEAGMINAIVRPDIYDRDRIAIRTEPYLWILGKLAKDDGTVNVITEEVRPLRLRKQTVKERSEAAYNQSPYKFLTNLRREA